MVTALIGCLLGLATMGLLASPYPVLALAPSLAALGGAVLVRKPELALYAIVAMIPFGAYRKLGGVNLPWLLAAFLLALLPLRMALQRRVPGLAPTPLWPMLLAYVAVNALATLTSPFPDVARHELTMIAAAQMMVLLTMSYLSPDGLLRVMHRVVVWSISLGSLLGLVGFVFGIGALSEDNPDGADYRAVGGAIDPNNQSIMTLFALPLAVHLALTAESRKERLVMAALAFLNVVGVLLTMSRSGFLMLMLTAGLLFWHYRGLLRPRRLGVLIAGAMVGGVAVLAVLPPEFYERQSSLASWEDRSLSRRTSYLTVAARTVAEHPLLGTGPGTFPEHYARSDFTRLYTSEVSRMRREAHNTYLEVTVGSGLVGLALYVGVVLLALRHIGEAARAFERRGDARAADLMRCYRIGFSVLAIFLLMLSDTYHKYMLLSLVLSQVALRVSGALEDRAERKAARSGPSINRKYAR